MSITLREAVEEDLATVVTLYNLMWTKSDTPLTMKLAKSVFDGVARHPRHSMLVAELDGRIVGTFMILLDKDESGSPVAFIENVVVHPKFQRRGVGRRMMDYATEYGKQAGCDHLVLANREGWEHSSSYFESLGFVRSGQTLVKDIAVKKGT